MNDSSQKNNINKHFTIELPVPQIFEKYSTEQKNEIMDYLNQLNDIEKKAYRIAMEHLGSSFHILKSNGFNEWKKKK